MSSSKRSLGSLVVIALVFGALVSSARAETSPNFRIHALVRGVDLG